MRLIAEARFDEVRLLQGGSERIAPGIRARIRQGDAVRTLTIRALQGRVAELVPPLEQLSARFPLASIWSSALAYYYAASGRIGDARYQLRRLAHHDFDGVRCDHSWISSMTYLASTAAECQEQTLCESLYRKLLPYGARVIVLGLWGPVRGTVNHTLGVLSLELKWYDRAQAHLESAVRAHETLGFPVYAELARLDFARLLLARGERAGRAQAVTMIAQAEAFAAARGVGEISRRARRARREYGLPTTSAL